jgi:tetratricopeptide (TPR) repeat protein
MADLEKAINEARQAIEAVSHDHPNRAAYLSNLGNILGQQYTRTGKIKDLKEAIQVTQQAVEITPHGHPQQARRLNNLGNRLESWYEQTGDITDLEEAIRVAKEGFDLTPYDHPERAISLSNLGNKLESRYLRTGEIGDLEEAIYMARQAVELTRDDDPDRAVWLNNLGNKLTRRFWRSGSMVDLEAAIQLAREAVETKSDSNEEWAAKLNNLGVMLDRRYARTGEMVDLEEGIKVARQAIELTPDDYPSRPLWLTNLGTKLERRHSRLGTMTDLEEAICVARQAVGLTPQGNPSLAVYLNNLGNKLRSRYDQIGEMADLEQAIFVTRQAVALTPDKHPDRLARMNNLASKLQSRYSRTGERVDLEEAIRLARQAVALTPDDHPDQTGRMNNLGSMLESRYELVKEMADLEEASELLLTAWNYQMAIPFDRVKAAARCLKLLAKIGKVDAAAKLGKDVIQLLPTVNTRLLDHSDQQFVMAAFAGIATDLCAFLLESGQPEEALQYLEKGRAVILGQLIDSRSDVSDLSQQHPKVALQYEKLLNEINTPISSLEPGPTKTQALKLRRQAVAELDTCIETIRELPGYERFLLGHTTAEMQAAAKCGPIVVINVSEYRCDAILVEQHLIRSLHLPQINIKDIKEKLRDFSLGCPQVLEWLWDVVANPILEALGFTQPHLNNDWPHIWWIPTGPLSKFPLHAAGHHAKGSTQTVLDRAMSSYSASVKAVIHRRRRIPTTMLTIPNQVLLVAMPNTPELNKLPFAAREIEMLRGFCKSMAFDPIEPRRRKQDILSFLPACKIFHFAGHGCTDSVDPLQSHLLLEDWKSEKLTVATLLDINLSKHSPFLAYLSACGTGEIKDERLFDESIHLISACQLAGFRHVIGTLWEVNDESCVDMSRITYEEMRSGGMADESVCRGLHKAIRNLRDQWIRLSERTRNGDKSGKNSDTRPADDKVVAMSVNDGDQRDARVPRDAVLCDDDDEAVLNWVPYVHFGV